MALSILHRGSGAALTGGALLITWWVIAIASGPAAYAHFSDIMGGIIGKIILFGFTYALMVHLCNGIRHLFWDMGKGFEREDAHRSSHLVLISSVILAILSWVIGYGLI